MEDPNLIEFPPQLQLVHPSEHVVSRISHLRFAEEPDAASIDESEDALDPEVQFLAHFSCSCCLNREAWLDRETLTSEFGVSGDKLNLLEATAQKERQEKITRRNAQAIQDFLNFRDDHGFTLVTFCEQPPRFSTVDNHGFCDSDSEEEEEEVVSCCASDDASDEVSSEEMVGLWDNSAEKELMTSTKQQRSFCSSSSPLDGQNNSRLGCGSPACCSSQDHKDCMHFR